MGFERVAYRLDFDDTKWAGLEVRARGVTLDEAMQLQQLLDLGSGILAEDAEQDRRRYFTLLTSIVIDWNRTDSGEPVPVDEKHMALEEIGMLQAMTHAYLRGVFEVPPPLSLPSSDTGPSEEQFLLMEQLSESLPS